MLFGYMFLTLFFISSIRFLTLNRVLAWRQVILSMYSGHCPSLHEFTSCGSYFTFDLFFPYSSIFVIQIVFVLSFIAHFTLSIYLLSQLHILFSATLFNVGLCHQGFLIILSCMLSLFLLLVIHLSARPVSM